MDAEECRKRSAEEQTEDKLQGKAQILEGAPVPTPARRPPFDALGERLVCRRPLTNRRVPTHHEDEDTSIAVDRAHLLAAAPTLLSGELLDWEVQEVDG